MIAFQWSSVPDWMRIVAGEVNRMIGLGVTKAGSVSVANGARVDFGYTFDSAPAVQLTHLGTSIAIISSVFAVDQTGFTLNHNNGATATMFYWTATEIK